jgi:DNA-binding LytR/AlgR family response regulator
MTSNDTDNRTPLRIYCIEDNPLIVFHLEHLIEEAGHVCAGFADSFSQLKADPAIASIDGALIDIDLADGRTGPDAAAWLKDQGIASIFVTGQQDVAALHADRALGVIVKPISSDELFEKLNLFYGLV